MEYCFCDAEKNDHSASYAIVIFDEKTQIIRIIKRIVNKKNRIESLEEKAIKEALKLYPLSKIFTDHKKLAQKNDVCFLKSEINPAHYALKNFKCGDKKFKAEERICFFKWNNYKNYSKKQKLTEIIKKILKITANN